MGPGAAQSTLLERCIRSIRHRGQFLGPIVVLTDAPRSRYHSLQAQDPHKNVIVLQPLRQQDWNWDLRRDMPYKRFKTYLLEYLDQDRLLWNSVTLVYYLDIDIVVGRNLPDWMDHVEDTYLAQNNNTSSASRMIFFQGNYKSPYGPLQGGQFLVQRNQESQACLLRWRYHMDAHPLEHKDQKALELLWNEQQAQEDANTTTKANSSSTTTTAITTTKCDLTAMPHAPHLQFLSKNSMERLLLKKTTSTSISISTNDNDDQQPYPYPYPYPTLMHIKNTQHASRIPDALQKQFFQQLLDLSPTETKGITGKVRIRPNRTWSAEQMKRNMEQETGGTNRKERN
jgi:hypothetical protein